jgi:hypothetical protein
MTRIKSVFIRVIRGSNYRLTVAPWCFMIRVNTGKEVILKYMSSNHSEVAAA